MSDYVHKDLVNRYIHMGMLRGISALETVFEEMDPPEVLKKLFSDIRDDALDFIDEYQITMIHQVVWSVHETIEEEGGES
jgi:hypothetical protein